MTMKDLFVANLKLRLLIVKIKDSSPNLLEKQNSRVFKIISLKLILSILFESKMI